SALARRRKSNGGNHRPGAEGEPPQGTDRERCLEQDAEDDRGRSGAQKVASALRPCDRNPQEVLRARREERSAYWRRCAAGRIASVIAAETLDVERDRTQGGAGAGSFV